MQARTLTLGAAAALVSAAFAHQRAWLAERTNPLIGSFIDVDGMRMQRAVRARGNSLPGDRSRPAGVRPHPASAAQRLGTARAGRAAALDARAAWHRAADCLRAFVRRARRIGFRP